MIVWVLKSALVIGTGVLRQMRPGTASNIEGGFGNAVMAMQIPVMASF
jgi:hypothetical protein